MSAPVVEHWFDLICPFCYIAQDRNRILRERGISVIEHGIQIHPEIGPGGTVVGPRVGPTYDALDRLAAEAGLPLRWTARISHSRPALAAHEWIASVDQEAAKRFASSLFDAYFGQARDIEDQSLILDLAARAGADADVLSESWVQADGLLLASEERAAGFGLHGTPAWVFGGQQVPGLQSRDWFARWADVLTENAETVAQ